jgi:sulfide:quinone oxidoreductase
MHHVLILGAGFGGLELAARLSDSLTDEVHITLIDQNDAFVFGFSKLEILFGRQTRDEVRYPYREISRPGVEFRQERVTSIDPQTRQVLTDGGTYEPDILVVALGADYDPAATPGFVEDGYEYYSVAGAERLGEVLASFSGGRVLVAILGVPFKCPPAPYEAALLLHDDLVDRGLREATQIQVISPMDSPIPVSRETSAAIVRALATRDIGYTPGRRVHALDPDAHVAQLKSGTLAYDLFIGIPVHRAPAVVEASGLTVGGNDGWVAVDPRNLATHFPGVYALGDCADAPVPRAGCSPRPQHAPSPTTSPPDCTAREGSTPTTARGRATSSSAAAWSARSTPTFCPGRRRRRRSLGHPGSWPPRSTGSSPFGDGAGSAAEPGGDGPVLDARPLPCLSLWELIYRLWPHHRPCRRHPGEPRPPLHA